MKAKASLKSANSRWREMAAASGSSDQPGSWDNSPGSSAGSSLAGHAGPFERLRTAAMSTTLGPGGRPSPRRGFSARQCAASLAANSALARAAARAPPRARDRLRAARRTRPPAPPRSAPPADCPADARAAPRYTRNGIENASGRTAMPAPARQRQRRQRIDDGQARGRAAPSRTRPRRCPSRRPVGGRRRPRRTPCRPTGGSGRAGGS